MTASPGAAETSDGARRVFDRDTRLAGWDAWRRAWQARMPLVQCYTATLDALASHVEWRVKLAYNDGLIDGREAERQAAMHLHRRSMVSGALGYILTNGRWHLSCSSPGCGWSTTKQRRIDVVRQYRRHAVADHA